MEGTTILLVEDDPAIQEMIIDYFEAGGFRICCTPSGSDALSILEKEPVRLVLLDIMLPDTDGFRICRAIREISKIPVIYLTALEAEPMQLKGYQAGADDYITKPFSLPLLLAKVNALIKRSDTMKEQPPETILRAGRLSLDINGHKVCLSGEELSLADKEYHLLLYLLKNQNLVLSREQILNHVWGIDVTVIDRVVDKHMTKLRRTLGEAGRMIKTISKAGYVLKNTDGE